MEELIVKLKKPYKFEGKEYTNIDLSGLDEMTVKDCIAAQKIAAKGEVIPLIETDLKYLTILAAKASNLPVEFFESMPPKQFRAISSKVQNFLLDADSEE